ncbi:uncharacterized protein RCC_10358 [Ramularia collo-cygni]|uniref:F-box domain-containing protein n=1 Tax=Ramularia collo-cygni TaxID=112498 RepID=A0A2D3V9D2_9PEZI|nr:uncharacterized protein RCC_10358 [Ramularia collo-cygni]CZT24633.1 uncharacterized protein RCC_10358 [Ramularia collo-cygni]
MQGKPQSIEEIKAEQIMRSKQRTGVLGAAHEVSGGEAPSEGKGDAAQRVFGTIELLEMILLDLPTQKLYTCQRTSKTFRDTIAQSLKLKRKMFLAPEPLEAHATSKPKANPLLSGQFWDCADVDLETMQKCFFGPFKTGTSPVPELTSGKFTIVMLEDEDQVLSASRDSADGWVGDESWMKMLVVQRAQGPIIVGVGSMLGLTTLDEGNLLYKSSTMGELYHWALDQDKSDTSSWNISDI